MPFPWSRKQDIEHYLQIAQEIDWGPDGGLSIQEKVKRIALQASTGAQIATATLGAQKVLNYSQTQTSAASALNGEREWQPSLTKCPMIDDIKWPRGFTWCKKYCRVGFDGLTPGDRDRVITGLGMNDDSASAFDYYIIRNLIRLGYTWEAIDEFWHRNDLRLHRPDKEQRNADYVKMTFNKALEHIQTSRAEQKTEQKENKKTTRQPIFEEGLQTFIYIKDDTAVCVLNGILRIEAIYEDQNAIKYNDRDWYKATIWSADPSHPDGYRVYNRVIPGQAFSSVAAFKEFTGGMITVPTDRGSHLQHLKSHVLNAVNGTAPRLPFYQRLAYEEHTFIYPSYTVTSSGIILRDNEELQKFLASKNPIQNWFPAPKLSREQVQKLVADNFPDLTKIHLPSLVCSVFGMISASLIRPILEAKLNISDYHLPTLNIRGASNSGKTETVRKLYSICGIGSGKNMGIVSANTTPFSMRKILDTLSFLPLMMDEFKDYGENRKNLTTIREVFRQVYSGEGMFRGTKELGLVSLSLHLALIIIGETPLETTGNIADVTRLICIDTDTYDLKQSRDAYLGTKQIPFHEMGPYLNEFILNCDPNFFLERYNVHLEKALGALERYFGQEIYRVAHNVAVTTHGCEVLDAFTSTFSGVSPLAKMDPFEVLINHTIEWAARDHSVVIEKHTVLNSQPKELKGKEHEIPQHTAIIRDEFYEFVSTYLLLAQTQHASFLTVSGFHQYKHEPLALNDPKAKSLDIHLDTAYLIYYDYCLKARKNSVTKKALLGLIRKHAAQKSPLILKAHKVRKIKDGQSGSYISIKVLSLNIDVVRGLGLIPAAATNVEYGKKQENNEHPDKKSIDKPPKPR